MADWRLSDWLAPWLRVGDERSVGQPALDSRRVGAGGVFLACRGESVHGAQYVEAALAVGVSAVLWEPTDDLDQQALEAACQRAGVSAIAFPNLSQYAGALAARYYNHPAEALWLFGVTGTDGKTSVTQFLARAIGGARGDCGVIGTLGWGWPGELAGADLTTPDAVTLQSWLAALRDAGASAVAMEVSSHALAQGRVNALDFDVAVLTNLDHDHLDYHGSLAAYRAAKQRLFYTGRPVPVLNLDDEWGQSLHAELAEREPVGYSLSAVSNAAVWCRRFAPQATGMRVDFVAGDAELTVELPLIGRFNVANVLAAAGALLAGGSEPAALAECLSRIQAVPGRMELVSGAQHGPAVIVDYAHTPGALAAVLAAVREHCDGALWLVFGCGGDRDRSKRHGMGGIAARDADQVVVTNDNPRYEDPQRIIADICAGGGGHFEVIADRGAAIRHAVHQADAADCVVIAGKGHEAHQLIADQCQLFSDRQEASRALEEVA